MTWYLTSDPNTQNKPCEQNKTQTLIFFQFLSILGRVRIVQGF